MQRPHIQTDIHKCDIREVMLGTLVQSEMLWQLSLTLSLEFCANIAYRVLYVWTALLIQSVPSGHTFKTQFTGWFLSPVQTEAPRGAFSCFLDSRLFVSLLLLMVIHPVLVQWARGSFPGTQYFSLRHLLLEAISCTAGKMCGAMFSVP